MKDKSNKDLLKVVVQTMIAFEKLQWLIVQVQTMPFIGPESDAMHRRWMMEMENQKNRFLEDCNAAMAELETRHADGTQENNEAGGKGRNGRKTKAGQKGKLQRNSR